MNLDPIVLYVEDDEKSRMVIEMILTRRMKFSNVIFFEDSVDFELRIQNLEKCPDIVLLDIQVKPLDGFKMLAILRKIERLRSIPIVALTASVMNEEVKLLQDAGFDGCIAKPLDVVSFPETFMSLLNGNHIWNIT